MHEMRPFDIEPNYYEDLLISQNKIKTPRDANLENNFGLTKSEFMKKTMNDN